MNGKLKLIVGLVVAGILLLFALIGIKNTFAPDDSAASLNDQHWQPPTAVLPNANLPSIDTPSSKLTRPLNDKAPPEPQTIELVGEEPPARQPPVSSNIVQPDAVEPAPVAQPAPRQPAPVAQPAPAPVAKTGMLEIVAQTERGKPLNADIYVQQDGKNIDKVSATSKASFTLKPGTYKVTARADGYGSVTRSIQVSSGAAVSEIFALPVIAAEAPTPIRAPVDQPAPAPRQPAPAPVAQPAPRQPAPAPVAAEGQLRLAAVSAEDGRPLAVDFTISRLDGAVIERVNGVPMTELTLPAQEFVVRFNYQGIEGYKSLKVAGGQTTAHTFAIRGTGAPPAPATPAPTTMPELLPPPDMGQAPPTQPPGSDQPQPSLEDTLLQMLQDEVQRQLNK